MHAPIRKLPASALARVARPGALDVRVFGRRSGRRHMRGFFGSPGEFLTMAGTEPAARQRVRAMPRPSRQDGSHDAATRLTAEQRATLLLPTTAPCPRPHGPAGHPHAARPLYPSPP